MIHLKVGRNIIELDENDLILDNGSCYQIITKRIGKGTRKTIPTMSKKLFTDLKNCALIYTSEGLHLLAVKRYKENGMTNVTFWKFDIERMQKLGY